MPQLVQCEVGHRIKETHRATARRFSEKRDLGQCYCGKSIQYKVTQKDPSDGKIRTYNILRVKTLLSREAAEKQGWDPMVFLLKNQETETIVMWPYYWKKDRNKKWANGQYPPLLKISDMEQVIKEFKAVI
jgi:hypothetical protein